MVEIACFGGFLVHRKAPIRAQPTTQRRRRSATGSTTKNHWMRGWLARQLVQLGLKINVQPPTTISTPNSRYKNAPAFFSTPHCFETSAPSQLRTSTISNPTRTSDPPANILSIEGSSRCNTAKNHAAIPNTRILSGQRADAAGTFICLTAHTICLHSRTEPLAAGPALDAWRRKSETRPLQGG